MQEYDSVQLEVQGVSEWNTGNDQKRTLGSQTEGDNGVLYEPRDPNEVLAPPYAKNKVE